MKQATYHKLALIAWPLLLLFANDGWNYTPLGWVDQWSNVGFFHDFAGRMTHANSGYEIDRVAWTGLGHLFFLVLPNALANTLFHLSLYVVLLLTAYSILSHHVDRRVALLAVLLAGAYKPLLVAIGDNYPDGGVIVYFLLCYRCLQARSQSLTTLFCAGVFYGLALFSHPFSLLFFIPLATQWWFTRTASDVRHKIKDVLTGAAGVFAICVLKVLVQLWISGEWWLFSATTSAAETITSTSPQWVMPYAWPAMILPGIVTFAALLAALYRKRRRQEHPEEPWSQLDLWLGQHLAMVSIIVLIQLVLFPVFAYYYYRSFALPTLVLAGAALLQLAGAARALTPARIVGIAAACLVSLRAPVSQEALFSPAGIFFAGLLLVGFILTCIGRPDRAWSSILAVTAALFLLNESSVKERFFTAQDGRRASEFELVFAVNELAEKATRGQQYYYWYDNGALEDDVLAFQSIHAFHGWGAAIGTEFPRVDSESAHNFLADATEETPRFVVVLSNYLDPGEDASMLLHDARIIANKEFASWRYHVFVAVLEVTQPYP